MSCPSKQLGNRRLPPLPNERSSPLVRLSSAANRTNHSTPVAQHQQKSKQNNEKRKHNQLNNIHKNNPDIENAFRQGPFRVPLHDIQIHPIVTLPPNKQNKRDPMLLLQDLSNIDPDIIYEFLNNSPELMKQYVQDFITKEELSTWLDLKHLEKFQQRLSISSFDGLGMPPAASWKNTSNVERQQFIEKFVSEIRSINGDVRGNVLYKLADCCASSVNASGYNLYLADTNGKNIWRFIPESTSPVNLQLVKEGSTIACYVAASRDTISTTNLSGDERFPEGLGVKDTRAASVLCLPITQPDGELTGIMELTRLSNLHSFNESETQIVNGYLTWGSIVLHYAEIYHSMHKQRKLNEFLLNVTKSIFQDIISMDKVIMKIMNFAQTLVDADRTSLFLVDNKTDELYARIFDVGTVFDTQLQNEIRFPKSKGVAGHVASTGDTLNIRNAYDDPRFNREIDVKTGYKTNTLLCMPIFIRGNLIGVVQMVNKKQGVFTSADEKAFQTFAVYCGLALHHAKLYDKIRRSEQKYKVAIEVLSYHSMCTENEISEVKNFKIQRPREAIEGYKFNVFDLETIEMASIAINFFKEISQTDSRFDFDELTRFTLTVRKNYRGVPYHNWTHAFTVAHCMYCVVKSSKGILTGLEAVALYVSCLCHDLDHRGKNNEWMKNECTPLAAVYTTSTLEHHHFNQTITILQHEGHNIFSQLNSLEYKQTLGMIKECILATDLAQFFGNKAKLNDIVSKNMFNWDNEDHRKMFRALSMTACDLSACAKPWKVQFQTVKVIFQEFYAQGDEEKALGRTPVPMMDRDTADKLPNHQVGFLVGICIPGYDLLQKLIPGTKELLDGARKNLAVWSEMVKKQNEKKLRREEEEKTRLQEENKNIEKEMGLEEKE